MPAIAVNIRPDWTANWTKAKAEEELSGEGATFLFKGPGWYFSGTNGEAMLVVPATNLESADSPWKQSWPADTVFSFHVFGPGRHPAESFNAVFTAPTREQG